MNVDPIVAALAKSPIYIASGASESATIRDDIARVLSPKDGIKVVLLPADSTDALATVAKSIESQQPDGTTLVVARGNNVAAVSNSIPAGTTQDILGRAANVSNNGLDTIRTFVINTHSWQAAHPETVTSTAQPSGTGAPVVVFGGLSLIVVLVVAFGLFTIRKSRKLSARVSTDLPRELRPLVIELMTLRSKIKSSTMRDAIENLCEYTEGYAQRVGDSTGMMQLQSQLRDAKLICTTYADMEKSPKYYEAPGALRMQGEKAIDGLADSVLASVRRGNSKALFDYQIGAKILGAQRFK